MSSASLTNPSGGTPACRAPGLAGAGPQIVAAAQPALSLSRLVEAVLQKLIDAEESFTAYDVTMILRATISPSHCPLPHYDRPGTPGVQPEVHRQMRGYLISGIYTQRTAYPNGVDPACLYVLITPFGAAVRSGNPRATYLTDQEWECVRALLPPQKPATGRPNADHRTVVGGILWVQRTGRSWRQLPTSFGKWSTAYSRYRRWQHAGLWPHITAALAA